MSIKTTIIDKIDGISNRIDNKLISYVSRYVNQDMSKLEKAISIYLVLGDILCYSPYFTLTNDYNKISRVSEITLDNNEIICKNWSILYCRLLRYFGIKSKVIRKKAHYKVELELDDVIYGIDATGYGGYGSYYNMSDIARIKYNFKIRGFRIVRMLSNKDNDVYRELENIINDVYDRQNRKVISEERILKLRNMVLTLAQEYGNKVGVGSNEDISHRLRLVNRFWHMDLNDSSLEKIQLFNSFINTIFDDYEEYGYEVKYYNVYGYVNHKLKMFKLIAIEVEDKYFYYMDDGNKFYAYDRSGIIEEFYKRNMRISEFSDVIGIYTDLEMFKIKLK